MSDNNVTVAEEQVTYANILNVGMWTGLALLVVMFFIYISGILPSLVAIEDLSKYWHLTASDFHKELGTPIGWGWLAHVGKGDYLNFVGIAILAGLTIVCYIAIMPALKRKKDTAYLVIAVLEVVVLTLAASGILQSGH
ncbi:MAG TPA: hypothetical protein DCO77_03530 [Nitrospiraceae bacterium]|nr:hypothetical protein [Nitrospiraceae bacterium]